MNLGRYGIMVSEPEEITLSIARPEATGMQRLPPLLQRRMEEAVSHVKFTLSHNALMERRG